MHHLVPIIDIDIDIDVQFVFSSFSFFPFHVTSPLSPLGLILCISLEESPSPPSQASIRIHSGLIFCGKQEKRKLSLQVQVQEAEIDSILHVYNVYEQ